MNRQYECSILAGYLVRLLRRVRQDSAAGRVLADWLKEHDGLLEAGLEAAQRGARGHGTEGGSRASLPKAKELAKCAKTWSEVTRVLEALAEERPAAEMDRLEANVMTLGAALGLDEVDGRLLSFLARYGSCGPLEALCDRMVDTWQFRSEDLLSALLDLDKAQLRWRLEAGALPKYRLVEYYPDCQGALQYEMPYALRRALLPPARGLADIERALIGPARPAELKPADFGHLGTAPDFVSALLGRAAAQRAKGINILVYGPPGTGKTAFCSTMAAGLGMTLHAVGEASDQRREPSRRDRLSAFLLGRQLARHRPGALLLVDEMEDVLETGSRRTFGGRMVPCGGSKVFMHFLLEENPVPTFWTANDIELFDPALLRRMSFALQMKVPPRSVRSRIWQRLLEQNELDSGPLGAEELARAHAMAPGAAAAALRAARLAGGGSRQVAAAVQAAETAQNHGRRRAPRARSSSSFDLGLVRADTDLAALTVRLADRDAPRDISLCLYGPPGTGKSAYLRHLAARMGLEVGLLRVSDLLSKWIGESEQNIAQAFAEAREAGSFLIIDEVDSLLMDRRGAQRSWEVSQVNELLTWMETHDLPFACTTNLMANLDRAALRRFDFKVKFDYLAAEQLEQAFRHFFGRPASPAVRRLTALTPGDFASVARRLRLLEAPDEAAILGLLKQECVLKGERPQPIGFDTRP